MVVVKAYFFKLGLSLLTHRRRHDFPVRCKRPLDRMELQSLGPYFFTWFNSTSSSSAFHGPFLIPSSLFPSIAQNSHSQNSQKSLINTFTFHWIFVLFFCFVLSNASLGFFLCFWFFDSLLSCVCFPYPLFGVTVKTVTPTTLHETAPLPQIFLWFETWHLVK